MMDLKKPLFWNLKKPSFISYLLIPFTIPIILNNFIIKIKKKIKFGTSLLGTKFHVKLLDGKDINLDFDGPIYDGDLRAVQNYGLPDMNGGRGDLVVKFEIEKELNFTKDQIKLITQFFPMDKFSVEDCEDVKAIDPESFQNEFNEDQPQGVQCAQQ